MICLINKRVWHYQKHLSGILARKLWPSCKESGSDVDILVQYDRSRPIGLMKIASMKADLEDLLKCEVDLVEEGTLRPWAVESVNRDKKLIYERA